MTAPSAVTRFTSSAYARGCLASTVVLDEAVGQGDDRCSMRSALVVVSLVAALASAPIASSGRHVTYRMDHVTDGDTVVLRNGQRVRLVQIDTPEVFFGTECYGPQASAISKRLLPEGVRVRLQPEPATDRVDDYGRLLRYVVRARDSVNINIRLVALGAAAPYFYMGRRGRYANRLETIAKRARAKHLGARAHARRMTRTEASRRGASSRSGMRRRPTLEARLQDLQMRLRLASWKHRTSGTRVAAMSRSPTTLLAKVRKTWCSYPSPSAWSSPGTCRCSGTSAYASRRSPG